MLYLPYAEEGLALARACAGAVRSAGTEKVAGIYVQGHGLMTFGESAQEAFEPMEKFTRLAGDYLQKRAPMEVPDTGSQDGGFETRPTVIDGDESETANIDGELETRSTDFDLTRETDPPIGKQLADLRKAVCQASGKPLILTWHATPVESEATEVKPAIAAHAHYLRRQPMVRQGMAHHLLAGQDEEAYVEDYRQAFKACGFESAPTGLDLAPRVVLDPHLGLCTLGRTAQEARLAAKLFRYNAAVAVRASVLGGYLPLAEGKLLAAETASLKEEPVDALFRDEVTKITERKEAPFTGEVALVTGGASGIGKACVEALLRRGAAVVSLDINPKVGSLYDRADYLGLECDLTDETAILRCFEIFTRAYGGLDMLVLNAGVFPAGCRIELLSLEEWQRVMRINLDSNLVVLREAHPLLKQSPNGGRVLVNASKNVLAPGAGAAAYSASKAAVTQMARVAALEWGKDGIRVNMIHPDAVFDTGIWSEDVLQVRAAHYGLTVQQYKTRNVLGVELNSHYVAELVAEMLGPALREDHRGADPGGWGE